MKVLILSLAIAGFALANNVSEWKPKYSLKKLDTKGRILKSSDTKKSDMIKYRSSAISKAKSYNEEATSDTGLLSLYKRKYGTKKQYQELKNKTLALTQKSVPTLIKVIKGSDYPDKNRWIAMFMLGRVMGKKSAKFISKFTEHPNWMLRLASLKVLLALNQSKYKGIYVKKLKDKAMIVRHQALENIKKLQLKELAPYVWAMLYDKSNYAGTKGARKRAHIIKEAIKIVGDLGFEKSKKPMLKMMGDKKYIDVYNELDYALNKLSDNKSPEGGMKAKVHFWKRKSVGSKIIR